MDDKHFDALSRKWARGTPRRDVMRGLIGGAGGATLGWLGASSAIAGRKKRRRKKGSATVEACHNGETIRVPQSAVHGLLLNGDTLGACPPASPPRGGGALPPCDVCPTCPFTTIQAAVDAARTADTIRLCAGTYSESIAIPARADLQALLIVGAGPDAGATVIDGGGFGSVLRVPGGMSLLLHRLTIAGGNADQGGGIASAAQSLNLIDVRVTGNNAALGGGGIAFIGGEGGRLELSATDVTNNTANLGGGIFTIGSGTVIIRNDSRITGNRARRNGGGIQNGGGTVTIEDAVVSGNTPNNCVGVEGC